MYHIDDMEPEELAKEELSDFYLDQEVSLWGKSVLKNGICNFVNFITFCNKNKLSFDAISVELVQGGLNLKLGITFKCKKSDFDNLCGRVVKELDSGVISEYCDQEYISLARILDKRLENHEHTIKCIRDWKLGLIK